MDFLKDYSGLPASLLENLSDYDYGIMPLSCNSCRTDGKECSSDSKICINDGSSCGDCGDCSIDHSGCSSDGVCDDICYDTPVPRPTGTGQMTIVSKTSTSITVRIKRISNATVHHVVCRLSTETAILKSVDITGTETTATITGLSPGTEYALNYRGQNASGNNGWMALPLFVTTPSGDVEKWDWNSSNGNASDSATRAAYEAVTSHGSTSDFSYLVWNDMVDKVLEILDAKGESWIDRYLSSAATKMSSSDTTLTASRFNSLRYNIGYRYSTGITDRVRGDTVYGWYFTHLADCMNNWIDQ